MIDKYRKITKEELYNTMGKHYLWMHGCSSGKRAVFMHVDFSNVDLKEYDLSMVGIYCCFLFGRGIADSRDNYNYTDLYNWAILPIPSSYH